MFSRLCKIDAIAMKQLKPLCANLKLSPMHGCEERMGHKGVQRQRHDASAVAAAVGEKANLGTKQR